MASLALTGLDWTHAFRGNIIDVVILTLLVIGPPMVLASP